MSLDDLERVGQIGRMDVDRAEIAGLLKKAGRKLADAKNETISVETRLEQAYTVILTCAFIALRATGFRVLSVSATHYTAIETLRYSIGLDDEKIEYFQSLRSLRHREVYGADPYVSIEDVREAIKEAAELLRKSQEWLSSNYPQLIS